jgi:hypothetical protein
LPDVQALDRWRVVRYTDIRPIHKRLSFTLEPVKPARSWTRRLLN